MDDKKKEKDKKELRDEDLPDTTEEKFTDLLHKAIKPGQSVPEIKTESDQTDDYSEKDTSQDNSEDTSDEQRR